MTRKIQNRILLLLALITIGIVGGILASWHLDKQRITKLLEKEKSDQSALLRRVVDFKSASLTGFAYDYTYWDDFVQYMKEPDRQWAFDNIEVSLKTFDIDYAWVYSTDLDTVFTSNPGKNKNLSKVPIGASDLNWVVANGPLYNFFVLTDSTIIQISGGSIHPTFDEKRETPATGYLFVGRIWKDEYLQEIEQFTGSTLKLDTPVSGLAPRDSIDRKEFRALVFMPLQGWNDKPVSILGSETNVEIARDFFASTRNKMAVLLGSMLIALVIVSIILIRSINRPLRSLITSLMDDDPTPIEPLIHEKSEFGQIASLMDRFFLQKKKLVEEITERIKVEEELVIAKNHAEESDRLKTSFLNNLSHEIRTPMNAIVGFSELIDEPKISQEERREFTGIIRDSSYRLLGIITDLINLSTVESGQEVVSEEKIKLNQTLKDLHLEIKPAADQKGIDLILDMALKDDRSEVMLDKQKVHTILVNLLRNSIKFTKAGRIDFGYIIRTAEIEFFVSDTGMGIPEEKFDMIFARFQQADDSISRKFGGTGLGLPISKAYVELMGGRIWLKSEVGKGTKFFFTIPYKPV